jgi:hypothetical protein
MRCAIEARAPHPKSSRESRQHRYRPVALDNIAAFRDWLAFVEPYDEAHMMAIHLSGMQ